MSRFLCVILYLLAAGASAQAPLEALELDVVDQREHPDDAIERTAAKPRKNQDDDEDPGNKHLKMDSRLGTADEISVITSTRELAPLETHEEPPVLEEAHDRGHGHSLGHEKAGKGDDKGGGGSGGRDSDRSGKDDDRGGKDDDDDRKGGKGKGKGGGG